MLGKEEDLISIKVLMTPYLGSFHPRPQQGAYAAHTQDSSQLNIQCYECNEWGHYQSQCPRLARHVAVLNNNNSNSDCNPRNPQAGQTEGQGRGRST